ncbi:hypothetical protein [Sphingobium sp. CCH11-B1]|uniref:hypothetical protein n=1 Tax=Sphingobium sp. CCH11-B1 TaxID=1768781 RepID=UPI00082F8204|nr:hypothetical protein [Sphingobium sp. CCH11-B1]
MLIDGKPVYSSGTLIVPHGRSGAISVDGKIVDVTFSDGPLSAATVGGNLVFTGFDNPLGTSGVLPNFTVRGAPAEFAFVIYTIGSGAAVTRILHWSVYPV